MRTIHLLLAIAAAAFVAHAQVSPGPLSKAHHSLDSPLKCASCHSFGAGEAKLKCLNCHREIFELVKAHESMHGRVANRAKGDSDCARCHTEHYGENFRIFKWETSKEEFDHKQTGYLLLGKHGQLKCEECHNPKHITAADRKVIMVKDLTRTFEGLHPACLTCHEDHHAGQVSNQCQTCHDYTNWKQVKTFDHSTTRYPLTGKHENLECAKCHKPMLANAKVIQYKGLDFQSCTGCHQDPHHGAFAARCETCHNTENWKRVQISESNFDHNKTKFPLEGKHEGIACEKCHKDSNFKKPIEHEKCMDCHMDQHKGQFVSRADRGECGTCHVVADWKPATFTEEKHQATKYPLAGKHQGLACSKCHIPAGLDTNYYPKATACLDCHKDVHAGQFVEAPHFNRCEDCHKVEGFHPSTFTLKQHQKSTFALKGAHGAIACQDCHRKEDAPAGGDRKYHFANIACEGCHKDPHNGEFPTVLTAGIKQGESVCESCHELRTWRELKPFDHGTTTFALLGRHKVLNCVDCHRPENLEPNLEAKVEPNLGARAEPKLEKKLEPKLEKKSEPKLEKKLEPKLEKKSEPKLEAKVEPKLEAKVEPKLRAIPFKPAPEKCVGCHEDIHAGQFQKGPEVADCGTCHDTVHWAAGLFNHDTASSFSLAGAHEDVPCRLCHNEHREINGRNVVTYRGTPRECASCHR